MVKKIQPAILIDETKLTNGALNINTSFINKVNITKHTATKGGGEIAFLKEKCDPVTCMSQFSPLPLLFVYTELT